MHLVLSLQKDDLRSTVRPFIGKTDDPNNMDELLALDPEYVDVPFEWLPQGFTGKRIASFHDFEKTPDNLEEIYDELRSQTCDAVKIVTTANDGFDGLKMLSFLKKKAPEFPITAFCMGTKGVFTRVLQPLYGSFVSYSSLPGKPVAAGQLSFHEMELIYNFSRLSKKTRPYALIGTPLSKSRGFLTHNALFRRFHYDAVYVNIEIDDLQRALPYFEELGFQGLSVTMPLKKSFNTLTWENGNWIKENFDGIAGCDVLGSLDKKTVLIYGTGETARTIRDEAEKRGAKVFLKGRNDEVSCVPDLTVNATPVDMGRVDLDVRQDTETGLQMWLGQASRQLSRWIKPLTIPPSKSDALRACLFASLCEGTSSIFNIPESPDMQSMVEACRALGADIEQSGSCLAVEGFGKKRKLRKQIIDAGNSGIVLRFVAAVAATFSEEITIIGDQSMKERRSCEALLSGLQQLGAKVSSDNGHVPLTIQGPIRPGVVEIDGSDSQPVSALLIATALLDRPSTIHVKNPGEEPWVQFTHHWLKKLGKPFNHTVAADWSSLNAMIAAALITKGAHTFTGIDFNSPQGDREFLPILELMGARFTYDHNSITVYGGEKLFGKTIDINPSIDMVTLLAVLGTYAEGATHIVNASIARDKESNRLHTITQELKKMGASIEETPDGLVVQKSKLHGASVDAHDDHRIAIALGVASLMAEGITEISGKEVVKKSYPAFFDHLATFR